MTETPTKVIINCSTGKRQIVELTAEEIAEREQMAIEAEAQRLADEADAAKQEASRQSGIDKLIALGLTESEALALVK